MVGAVTLVSRGDFLVPSCLSLPSSSETSFPAGDKLCIFLLHHALCIVFHQPPYRPGCIIIPSPLAALRPSPATAKMMALVNTRKRKDTAGQRWASRDKDKIRVVEHSGHELLRNSARPVRPASTPAARRLDNFRRNSIKVFSFFRGGKGRPSL
jgi:hypothetical protein